MCFAIGGGARYTEALKGAVDAAVTLGAKLVNTYNVGIPLSIWGDAVKPAAGYAASKGVVITLENEAHDDSGLPENVAAVCERVGSPGLKTQYDPCNYFHGYVERYPHALRTGSRDTSATCISRVAAISRLPEIAAESARAQRCVEAPGISSATCRCPGSVLRRRRHRCRAEARRL